MWLLATESRKGIGILELVGGFCWGFMAHLIEYLRASRK
jgi:hypothetical protein